MNRILRREKERYGERILPDGDMYQQHLEFVDWARSYDHAKAPIRSVDLHKKWMRQLKCPIAKLNSDRPVRDLCDDVLAKAIV